MNKHELNDWFAKNFGELPDRAKRDMYDNEINELLMKLHKAREGYRLQIEREAMYEAVRMALEDQENGLMQLTWPPP